MRNTLRTFMPIFLALTVLYYPKAIAVTVNPDQIMFQSGPFTTEENFSQVSDLTIPTEDIVDGHYYRVFHFNVIPSLEQKQELLSAGVRILNYIPYNAFVVSIKSGSNLSSLSNFNIRSIVRLDRDRKSSRAVRENNIPSYAKPKQGYVDLIVQYFSDMNRSTVLNYFAKYEFEILKMLNVGSQCRIRIPNDRIGDLLDIPFVKYVEEMEAPSEPEDTRGRSLHRSNLINSESSTGMHYDGAGVSISLADDGEVGPHIDFQGRITQLISTGAGGSHGDMTAGILGGSGNLNPSNQGMASGAHIYIHDVNDGVNPYDHIYNAINYYNLYGAVITSTSYSQGCNDYNTISSTGDMIAHQNPYFNFVYSAGNRGQDDCGYGTNAAWGTITGGFKQGKNAIACGNLDAYGILDVTSSRGPAEDGRVKPDICSNGKNQNSTRDNNRYQVGGGTSAACPGIAGIIAQLVQAYREMHNGDEAPSALLKGVLLNSAEDIGNPGPDFTYGWGRVNAFRALTTLQDSRYLLDSVTQSTTRTHSIQVPANSKKLKCMLYWLDIEGDPLASIALVNDLDLIVKNPSNTSYEPWILDPTPVIANLTTNAVRGADHLNNMEQVTIDNPAPGTYSVEVTGGIITSASQQYYIIWELESEDVKLTYPNGAEGFVPGETEALRWDASEGTDLFNLEYSDDNGISWNNIMTAIPANVRQYDWVVPTIISDQVLVRLSRGSFTDQSDQPLSIQRLPSALTIDFVCSNVTQFSWTSAPGASGYEVSVLGSMYMDSVGTTTANTLQVALSDTVDTWFSVRSLGNHGGKGRRAVAVQRPAGLLNCSIADDLNLLNVQNPPAGFLFPCQDLSSLPLSVTIKNDGINLAHSFNLSYSINGATPVIETFTDTLFQGSTRIFTFSNLVDLSASGIYQIVFGLSYTPDANSSNNTINHQVEVFHSAVTPYVEDFQTSVFPPAGWEINSSGSGITWAEKSGIVGSDGNLTTAAWFDNYSYNNLGARDYLKSVLADFSGIANPRLTFDVAFANYTGRSDGLGIDISSDCGINFIPSAYLKAGATLATVPSSTSDWEPTQATHWRNDTLSLSAFADSLVMIRFVNINDYGNNLYIDNINLESVLNPGVSEQLRPVTLSLFPNPSSGIFNLEVRNLPSKELSVEVFDLNGRKLIAETFSNTNDTFKTSIDLDKQPAAVYFLRIYNEDKTYRLRLKKM
ncbi:MAG: T9SS type A sorting domain-containing protein [Bacteroidetes bacterium]|nr:MAG: T9SS type A sorting domain-containing protein [Bacteroidota bacterium]